MRKDDDDDLAPDENGLLNRGEMTLAEFDDANVPVDMNSSASIQDIS